MRWALLITAAALAASKESDTDAAYKRSRLVYEAKKNEPLAQNCHISIAVEKLETPAQETKLGR